MSNFFAKLSGVLFLGAMMLFLALGNNTTGADFHYAEVEVNDNGLIFSLPINDAETVSGLLLAHNITLTEHDILYPSLQDPVSPGTIIAIYRAKRVLVQDYIDGEQRDQEFFTHASTVNEVLSEARIELSAQDFVDPGINTGLYNNIQIAIVRVAHNTFTKRLEIPFETIEKKDPDLEKGKLIVDQTGVSGELVQEYGLEYNNGVLMRTRLLDEHVSKEPRNKIVRRGTKILVKDTQSGKASWYGAPSMSAAHKTYPFGSRVRVTNTSTGKSIIVTITDRGPYIDNRVIDLSRDAYAELAPVGSGTIPVYLELLAK